MEDLLDRHNTSDLRGMSVVFMPCDAMQRRPMSSCGVRLLVCPSVTFVYFVKTNKHIFNIFHHQVATILVFVVRCYA